MYIKLLEAAEQDLRDGYAFYENQARGVGRYFLDTLYSDIESLTVFPDIHPCKFGTYRQLLSKRFPFAVYYKITEGYVCVYAILDCRRNPEWISDRLK